MIVYHPVMLSVRNNWQFALRSKEVNKYKYYDSAIDLKHEARF